METYGGLKVGCEHVAEQRHAGQLLVIRPTYIVGPHDPTARFPYWVDRLARGGTVLCPGSPDVPFQYIDARDLAAFTVGLLEAGDEGTFHAVQPSPPYSFAEMLEEVRAAVAPDGTRLEWVPSAWLAERGVTPDDAAAVDGRRRPGVRPGHGPCARRRGRPACPTPGRDCRRHACVVVGSVVAVVRPEVRC